MDGVHDDEQRWTDRSHRVRMLVRARWAGVGFGLAQVLAYATMAYPAGVREAALAVVGAGAVANLFVAAVARDDRRAGAAGLAAAGVAIDLAFCSLLVLLFAFDPVSAVFVVLVLPLLEAAVLFGRRGALLAWGAAAALYAVREWYGTRFDNPFELESLTFRVGVLLLVAWVAGSAVSRLEEQRRTTAAALEELRRADLWRQRLVSMLAHDVRAPLAGARTSLVTVRERGDALDPATVDRLLEAGVRQTDRGLLLARDLLDMARGEAAEIELHPTDVDVAALVEDVTALVGSSGAVVAEVPQGTTAFVDRARLEQVLHNLVTNALTHGAAPVHVRAVGADDALQLEVRDHGPGVAEGVELFRPFRGVGEGSVGLGMWLVRHVVEAHGGTVHHEPADPGARFVVRLPRAAAAAGGTSDAPELAEATRGR